MTFDALNLLFPVVLAVHNAEEYARYGDFVRAYHRRLPRKLTTRRVMRYAAILLTVAVAILSGLTYVYKSAALITVSKIAVLALMLNGVGHCLLSLKERRLAPGTIRRSLLCCRTLHSQSLPCERAMATRSGHCFSTV